MALLLVKLDPPPGREEAWNNWLNTRHLVDRRQIPGINSAQRFVRIDRLPGSLVLPGQSIPEEPKYLHLYQLSRSGVLKGRPYQALREKEASLPDDSFENLTLRQARLARGVYEPIFSMPAEGSGADTRFVLMLGHEVPRNRHAEFNAWYNTEHIPAVFAVPHLFVSARRFKLNEQYPPTINPGGYLTQYITVYGVENPETLDSEAFVRAVRSPWTDWVRTWYRRKTCLLYQRLFQI